MKNLRVPRAWLPVGFLLGLIPGPQNYNFVLTAPDDIRQIGKGMLETAARNSVKVQLSVSGKEFSGSGMMSSPPPSEQKDLRSDRAFMAPRSLPYLKHGFATVKAKDGSPSLLVCEFYVRNEQVDGHCFDPAHTKAPPVHVHPAKG